MSLFCRALNRQETTAFMCGIFGANYLNKESVLSALKEIASRGPDNTGFQEIDKWQFGVNRLAIQDLSDNSNQPMSLDRTYILYNGELWNNSRNLFNYPYSTTGDTELILHLFNEHKEQSFKMLNGMFAIAILYNDSLYLSRDWI